jgi:Ras-related protein Rab-10
MGIMLVYDITDGKTFDNIGKWLRNIDENANEDVVKMIMGNKLDMEDKRVITTERGAAVAKDHGIPFVETSAKTNINVSRAFHDITLRILEKVCLFFISTYDFFELLNFFNFNLIAT